MLCNECGAQFVRRCDSISKESLVCVWNRKMDGTMFEPKNNHVFLTLGDSEKVEFT
jgi:hypothetical protein